MNIASTSRTLANGDGFTQLLIGIEWIYTTPRSPGRPIGRGREVSLVRPCFYLRSKALPRVRSQWRI